jgi:aminoglycoside phosphotransferase family enzyme/predicted kinase
MPHETAPTPDLDPRVETWLRAGADGRAPCERIIETSISWVFLFEDRALKLKKPVNFGFVDFTTVDLRGWAAKRELDFNRPAAPNLYRAVHAITLGPGGGLVFDGPGEVLEWALDMRRFPEGALLLRQLPADGALGEALGREIAQQHIGAEPGTAGGGAAGLAYVIESNTQQLRACAPDLGATAVETLISAAGLALAEARPQLDARLARGFCRACHGDLHTANIIVEAGRPVLFDCIEFNARLREIDIQYDLAFLLMDLTFRGSKAAANRALNGWLDATIRALGDDVFRGLALLPLQQSTRAVVRAHVCAREGKTSEGRAYLEAAIAFLAPSRPTLLAVGGLSGTGKTTYARARAPELGAAPGAIILRSDEIRKRLWRAQPLDRLEPEAYGPAANRDVYAEMRRLARLALGAGRTVIADAAFLDPAERAAIAGVAREGGVAFEGVWLEARADVLARRVAARRGDASDADVSVLQRQTTRDLGEITWRRQASADQPLS